MSKNIQSDNPDVVQEESGEDEFTEEGLINSLSENLSALTESEESKEESTEAELEEEEPEETEGEESEEVEEEEEESEDEEDDDVLSQIDVEALTKEQKVELAKMIGSELGVEFGKLRSESRKKDEQIAKLEKELNDGLSSLVPSDNQFSKVTSVEELQDKLKEIESNIAAASDFLGGDEDYIEVGGKDIDRKTIASWLKSYISQKEDIPKQMARINEMKSVSELNSKSIEKLKKELTWLEDSESEAYKSFETLKNDSDFDLLQRVSPKLASKLEGLLAHAANSMTTKPVSKKFTLPRKASKPISGKLGSSASSGKPSKSNNKKVDAARKRMLSGEVTEDDIITAAFAQHN